jgi:hypothetical protein
MRYKRVQAAVKHSLRALEVTCPRSGEFNAHFHVLLLVLQLRKRRISKVILGGMLANMCVESHLRDLLEQGFETVVAKDATVALCCFALGVDPESGCGTFRPLSAGSRMAG